MDILATTLGLGAFYAASAVSLALIWGTFGMLNLAHGAFITVGAYASLLLVNQLGVPPWTGILAGAAGGAAVGALINFLLVARVFARSIGATTGRCPCALDPFSSRPSCCWPSQPRPRWPAAAWT